MRVFVCAFIGSVAAASSHAAPLIAAAPSPDITLPEDWVRQAAVILPLIPVSDRAAAQRNYANMLIDVHRCDEAAILFQNDTKLDAAVTSTSMTHAIALRDMPCASRLAHVALGKIPASTDLTARGVQALRMRAGAAIVVGENPSTGFATIADAEQRLRDSPAADESGNEGTLWETRLTLLGIFAGGEFYRSTMEAYAKELATTVRRPPVQYWTPTTKGYVLQFAKSGRPDLVQMITAPLFPSQRREAATVQEMGEHWRYQASHKVRGCPILGAKTTDRSPASSAPMDILINLALRSQNVALTERCEAIAPSEIATVRSAGD